MDAGLLGLQREQLCLQRGLLGSSVGFYGGINYGYGYYGRGYYGGRWVGDTLPLQHGREPGKHQLDSKHVCRPSVPRNARGTRASFNGPGGVRTKPNAKEQAVASAEHVVPTSSQQSRVAAAASDPALHAGNNKGKPKADAVKTFESKHGPDLAGTAASAGSEGAATKNGAAEQAGAEKPVNEARHDRVEKGAGTAKQARSGKGSERVANNNSAPSRSSVKTTKNKHVASSQMHQATRGRHNGSGKMVGAPHNVRHASTAPHRAQAAGRGPQGAKHGQFAGNAGKKKKGGKG